MPVIARYALVTLTPLVLLILGATLWGGFAVMALIWLTLLAALLDRLLDRPKTDTDDHEPWSDRLSALLGAGHFVLLPLVLMALAGDTLGLGQKLALFFATASFFGQVSHPNAHELIHRRPWPLRALGAAVYTSVGFGHHVSAHRLVHHRFVGTIDDPNTPLPGESFWAYLPRAWAGSIRAGLEQEEDRLTRRGLPEHGWRNPYWIWGLGALLSLVIATALAGPTGFLSLIALGALTGAQILLSDYIQHYGLQRLPLPNGRLEPVSPHHSWNAPRGFSTYLMMNAPAHSEHHMHPDRPYDRLDPAAEVPMMPWSVPIMAMLATIPPVWHRVMDRRALRVMQAAQTRITTDSRPPSTPMPQHVPTPMEASAPESADDIIARVKRQLD